MNHPHDVCRPAEERQTVPSRPLYELAADLLEVERRIAELDGELTPDLLVQLDGAEASIEAKAERILRVITNLRAEALHPAGQAAAFLAESKRLNAAATRLTKRADQLEDYLRTHLERLGLSRLTAGTWTIVRKRNGQPSLQWTGAPEEVPESLRKTAVPQFDHAAALELFRRDPAALPPAVRVVHGSHLVIY